MPNASTRPGATGRWPGFAVPAAALLVTLLLTWLMSQVAYAADLSDPISGLAALILLPAPLLVGLIWGLALLTGRPHRLAVLAAVGWLAAGWLLVPATIILQLLGHVVAGLLAGLALSRRWRLDAAVLAMALALSPVLVWTTVQVPATEQLRIVNDEMLKSLEQNLPAGADPVQRARALDEQKRQLERITAMAAKIYPFVLSLGVLGQAGIVLSLLWLLVRALGMRPHRWLLPAFSRWRVPFYVVWVLVVGIGLLLTRQPPLTAIGLNLALLAAFVLSVQGIAVQFFVTGRMMSGLARVFYWLVMGFFFGPLIMASGVVLGLVDQWWDIRRLGDEPPAIAIVDPDEPEGPDDSDDDDDADDDNTGADDNDAPDDDQGETPADRFPRD